MVDGSRVRARGNRAGTARRRGAAGKARNCRLCAYPQKTKLAVIEAKRRGLPDTEGVGQAKQYAGKLQTRAPPSRPTARAFHPIDMTTGAEGYVQAWPSPDDLWAATFAEPNAWRDCFAAVPAVEKGGGWSLRYYQANAVNNALERVARRQAHTADAGDRDGQDIHRLSDRVEVVRGEMEPVRRAYRPRILFLADRNILANQAYNDFSSFAAFERTARTIVRTPSPRTDACRRMAASFSRSFKPS